jgi:hypothetical protein
LLKPGVVAPTTDVFYGYGFKNSFFKLTAGLERFIKISYIVKFIYSEKATKFCKISTLHLTAVLTVKSKVEILQNFVAFW